MKKTISAALAFIMLAAVIPSIVGCGGSDNTLHLLNWGEYLEPSLLKRFEEETGIKVKETCVTSNEEMLVMLEADDCPYDLCIPSDYAIERLIAHDRLAEIDFANVPNFKYIDPSLRDLSFDPGNKYSVPYTWGVLGIIYNTKMVDEADTGSWDLLWNEKYKGQIYMYDSVRDSMAAALRYCGYDINTVNPDELHKAADKLIEQIPLWKAKETDRIKENMIQEKGAIALVYSGDAVWCSEPVEGNPDLKFYIPEEGSNIYFDNIIIPKTSTKKAAAEKFINFLLDPEIAALNTEYLGFTSPNTEVFPRLSEEKGFKTNPAYNLIPEKIGDTETFRVNGVDNCVIFHDLGEQIELYETEWDRVNK